MASENWELVRSLEAVEVESPNSTRREVVQVFRQAVGADYAVFCNYRSGPEEYYFTNVVVAGDDFDSGSEEVPEHHRPIEPSDWDPRNPPKDAVGSFRAQSFRAGESTEGTPSGPCLDAVRRLRDIRHEAGVLLYGDSGLIGWIGVYRTADRAFGEEELEHLDALIEPAKRKFAAAERRVRRKLEEYPARLLVDPETLEVRGATRAGKSWLEDDRERRFREMIRKSPDPGEQRVRANLEGFLVWLEELMGEAGRRLLATIECPPSPRMAIETQLTPRQREVAGYAAAGATNREIAETLDISTDTVSDHLSETYERLGVANRVELARTIAESELD